MREVYNDIKNEDFETAAKKLRDFKTVSDKMIISVILISLVCGTLLTIIFNHIGLALFSMLADQSDLEMYPALASVQQSCSDFCNKIGFLGNTPKWYILVPVWIVAAYIVLYLSALGISKLSVRLTFRAKPCELEGSSEQKARALRSYINKISLGDDMDYQPYNHILAIVGALSFTASMMLPVFKSVKVTEAIFGTVVLAVAIYVIYLILLTGFLWLTSATLCRHSYTFDTDSKVKTALEKFIPKAQKKSYESSYSGLYTKPVEIPEEYRMTGDPYADYTIFSKIDFVPLSYEQREKVRETYFALHGTSFLEIEPDYDA